MRAALASPTLAITQIDAAINTVSSLRGSLGAVQNRLGSTINNLAIQVENISAAESRIRDVDVAFETAQLTRNNILQQASIAGRVSPDATAFVSGSGNAATFVLPLPFQPALLGIVFFQQAVVFDPGANVAGLVTSAATRGVVGF